MKTFNTLFLWISLCIGLNAQAGEGVYEPKRGDCLRSSPLTDRISGNSAHEPVNTNGLILDPNHRTTSHQLRFSSQKLKGVKGIIQQPACHPESLFVDSTATAAKPASIKSTALVVNAIGTRTRIAEAAVVQRDDRQFYMVSRDDWPAQRRGHEPGVVPELDVVSVGNLFMDQSLFRIASGAGGKVP